MYSILSPISKLSISAIISLPVCAVITLMAGCATQAKIEHIRPAEHSAGSADHLSLVQATGKPDLQDLLADTLRREAQYTNWWKFQNRRNQSIALFPRASAGRHIAGREPRKGEIYVRLDAYDAQVFAGDNNGKKEKNNPPKKSHGKVRLRFAATVVDDKGQLLMGEKEYYGIATGEIDTRYKRSRLVSEAGENGIESFLADITPHRMREGITIDKEAEDMQPIAELVAGGEYAEAHSRLQQMHQRSPRRADIIYNMAVLTDARGEFKEALKLYDKALKLGYKAFYTRSRQACARRLRERESLRK